MKTIEEIHQNHEEKLRKIRLRFKRNVTIVFLLTVLTIGALTILAINRLIQ